LAQDDDVAAAGAPRSRDESRAETRERLMAAARKLFARDGYTVTSLDRIASEAGYSKGAIYSNFRNKSEVFRAVIESEGKVNVASMIEAIRAAPTPDAVIEAVAQWADSRADEGNWAVTLLDHARQGGNRLRFEEPVLSFFRENWRQTGEALLERLPRPDLTAESLGAVVFALVYAPAMTFVSKPTIGDLVRITLRAILLPPAAGPEA
jgi:AcrR family transcriptional regulator